MAPRCRVLRETNRVGDRASVLILSVLFGCFSAIFGADAGRNVTWEPPNGWQLSSATPKPPGAGRETGIVESVYTIPQPGPNNESALCVVYFNALPAGNQPEPWGSHFTASTIEHWTSEFLSADGQWAKPSVTKRVVNGLSVTAFESEGGYFDGPGSVTPPYAQRRMLGAIIAAGTGRVTVKLIGSPLAVSASKEQWDQFISSFRQFP